MVCSYRSILVGVGVSLSVGCGSDGEDAATVTGGVSAGVADEMGVAPGQPAPAGPPGIGPGGLGGGALVGLLERDEAAASGCVDQYAAATERPPVLQFVVDTSGSMRWVAGTERLPEGGERSKWEITRDALALAISSMPDAAAVGVSYYPNTSGGPECHRPVVAAPIERLTPRHRELIQRVNGEQAPEGGTPTHAAYEFGVQQLDATPLLGSRFLVLITDGIPTYTLECGGDGQARVDGAPLVTSVERQYLDSGIKTFVIGSPGSEPARDELSKMAFVGGTGRPDCSVEAPGDCHFDMTGEADFSLALEQALGDIAEATLGCDYAVPEPPTGRSRLDLEDVSVVVESGGSPISEFSRASSEACESGWQYSPDGDSIVLCRSSCEELTRLIDEVPDLAVRVKFGCALTPT